VAPSINRFTCTTPPAIKRVALLAVAATVISAPAAFAENNNPSHARITYDPVTGQPTCTIVSSSDPSIQPGTVFTCPPSVVARPPAANSSSPPGSNRTADSTTPPVTHDGPSDSSSSTTSSSAAPTTPAEHGRILFANAINGGTTSGSVLRIANLGKASGRAQVVIVNPTDGQNLATWTSPELASHASMQIDVAAVASGAVTEPSVTTLPAAVTLRVSAGFSGTVQHLSRVPSGNVLLNASACGAAETAPRAQLGYVPAGTSQTGTWVRLVNAGRTAASADLTLHDAATGITLGSWASATIPAQGAVTVALSTITTSANIGAGTAAFLIESDHLAEGLRLEMGATDMQSGALIDQTVACAL